MNGGVDQAAQHKQQLGEGEKEPAADEEVFTREDGYNQLLAIFVVANRACQEEEAEAALDSPRAQVQKPQHLKSLDLLVQHSVLRVQ